MTISAETHKLASESAPGPAREINRNLDHTLLRSIAWTGVVKWGSHVMSWLSTIVVARLLAPSDYGLVAMATAFLGLVAVVNEFGLGSAIVMVRTLRQEQVGQLNSLALLLGLGGFVVAVWRPYR